MRTLLDVFTWLVSILSLTGFIPAGVAVLLAQSWHWTLEQTRTVARRLGVILSVGWWAIAVYGFRMQHAYDWIGGTMGTPVRVIAFTAWCLAPGVVAPFVAARLCGVCLRRTPAQDR